MTARILVFDDIPANVKLLEARLLAEYYEVLTASDGMTALSICEKTPVDLILLDIMMPGIDGFEVYHPQWSNHPRFLTMTGPYSVGDGDNKIYGGGNGVEIYVGRFSPDHTRVEAWVRVTANDAPDFFPDVWIDPAARVPVSARRDEAATGRTLDGTLPPSPIVVNARVTADVPLPTPRDIAPYRNGLLVLEYEVLEVIDGRYDNTMLLAAHWIIRDRALLDTAARPAGTVVRLTLEPYAAHTELEGERLVMDSDRFDLPLFYDLGVP